MTDPPDPRRLPARPDLAAAHLRGHVAAARFAEGAWFHVCAPVAALRRRARPEAPLDTQLLFGANLRVYERRQGWAWGQAADGYVGYVACHDLTPGALAATHCVARRTALVYRAPDAKAPDAMSLDMNARVAVQAKEGGFAKTQAGWLDAAALRALDAPGGDYVAAAEALTGVPYLWGGRSSRGLDCSGLVQAALEQAGAAAPRDSDMQEAELGRALAAGEPLRRGDLVFWTAHVGIMRDAAALLHANAHHMAVASEPLSRAAARLAKVAGPITSRRRL